MSDELRFTSEDILLKRDIDFINKIKYPDKYQYFNKFWKDYTREEKANLIMRYVDEIELDKVKNKYGMSKQVGKSDVFTKESLTKIQDKMRFHCMESFNKEYHTNYKLKPKLKGRNRDYNISEMGNYQNMKKSIEIHQSTLNKAKEKTDNLKNSTKEIREMLENLKSKGLIKN